MNAHAVDWPTAEAEALHDLANDAPASVAYERIASLVARLDDRHASFSPPNTPQVAAPQYPPKFDGPIAVLLGSGTMSSGEALALCFSSRSNVRSFGEPTSGLTTVTNIYTLRVGSSLNLPVSRMANVNGKPIDGAIRPDVAVPADEWPTSDDATAQTARKWLTENFQ